MINQGILIRDPDQQSESDRQGESDRRSGQSGSDKQGGSDRELGRVGLISKIWSVNLVARIGLGLCSVVSGALQCGDLGTTVILASTLDLTGKLGVDLGGGKGAKVRNCLEKKCLPEASANWMEPTSKVIYSNSFD